MAKDALEKRAALVAEMRSVNEDRSLTTADKRSRIEKMDGQVNALEAEARDAIESAEREERTEKSTGGPGKLFVPSRNDANPMEWRSLLPSGEEFRALVAEGAPGDGGHAVPGKVASTYIDRLRNRSVFLKAPGLNVVPFDGGSFKLPALASSTEPGVTAEGQPIAEASAQWLGHDFKPYKYATLYRASNEILSDAAIPMRDALADTMVRDVTVKIDGDAFGSATTNAVKGLTAAGQHTKIDLAAGELKWDAIVDAVSDVEAANGAATVVWCSPDMAKALRKERESGSTGAYLSGPVTGDPTATAQGLPLLVSASLPDRSVIVADASRVWFGVREDVRLAVSEHAYFTSDVVAFRLTYRCAGIVVAESTSVQWLQAAAS